MNSKVKCFSLDNIEVLFLDRRFTARTSERDGRFVGECTTTE